MVLSDSDVGNAIGVLRLCFVAALAPLWLLGGLALAWFGETLLGIASIVLGLVMIGGGYRLYRAIERPDVVRDDRTKAAQYRAGFNAFWTIVFLPSLYVAFAMFFPEVIAHRIARLGGFDLVWPVSVGCGFLVYLGTVAYYRFYGRETTVENDLEVHRAEHDLTQEELAMEVGVSRRTIDAVETGRYDPSLELALTLADRFDVQIEDVFRLPDG